jgi:hypothetical protein
VRWLDRTLIVGPHLALATTQKQFDKVMRHCQIPKAMRPTFKQSGSNASTLLLERDTGEYICIVSLHTIPRKTPKTVIYSLLVHEAVHVWQHKRKGIGEDSPSSEFEAYSIQAISQALFDEYERLK